VGLNRTRRTETETRLAFTSRFNRYRVIKWEKDLLWARKPNKNKKGLRGDIKGTAWGGDLALRIQFAGKAGREHIRRVQWGGEARKEWL